MQVIKIPSATDSLKNLKCQRVGEEEMISNICNGLHHASNHVDEVIGSLKDVATEDTISDRLFEVPENE